MMFNLKKEKPVKEAQIAPYEKYHRENTVGPVADDSSPIWEKNLPHRDGYEQSTTEDQMRDEWKVSDTDTKLIEKVLDEAKGYVTHRSDAADISVPPINALVEKIRQERFSNDYKVEKESNWTQTYNEKRQQGELPNWKKNAPQHDKIVLNNDPRRFEGMSNMPTHWDQADNDRARSTTTTIKPLVGNITTADIDSTVASIKSGQSIDFDTAMIAILRQADEEKRELTPIERKAVTDLKIARTKTLIEYARNNR